MSSATIMARLETLIESLADFGSDDVSQGDFRVLDRGSPPYAVIYPGGFETVWRSDDGRERVVRWTHYVEVFTRFLDDSYADLVDARQDVFDQLNVYPQLNGLAGILLAQLDSGGDVNFLYPPGGDVPAFVYYRLVHQAEEYITYEGEGEYV